MEINRGLQLSGACCHLQQHLTFTAVSFCPFNSMCRILEHFMFSHMTFSPCANRELVEELHPLMKEALERRPEVG